MFASPIEEIKNRLDVIEVIGGYIKLQKAGANYRAPCPFHAEKKPSFFVSPARQIWHCFGCGAGSNIFDFVMKIEGVEFGDALRILAQKAGVDLKPVSQEFKTARARLYEICELACRFFEKQLEGSKIGQEAGKYLLNRGISKESIKKWRLGYSPESWQGLSDFLVGKGYNREEIEKAGLAIKKDSGNYYDRFRARIIFPVFDLSSQPIGFGGRVFGKNSENETAKYINTSNTLLYDKSRVLYGLDKAKMEIRKKNECLLVEGYTDAIMLSQAGWQNVVANSGTALTPYQLKLLKRYTENLLTAYDMDIAGDSATKRGIDLAQTFGFNIKVVTYPEGTDPADIISKNPADWEKYIKDSKSILNFYFDTTFSRLDAKIPEKKKEIAKILLPVIKRIANGIERSFWIQELTKRLQVREEDVMEELKKTKANSEDAFLQTKEETAAPSPKTRKELLEEKLAALLLKFPENFNLVDRSDSEFLSPLISQIIFNHEDYKSKDSLEKLSPEFANLINCLWLKLEVDEEEINPNEEFKNCLREIRFLGIRNKLDEISRSIKIAEQEKNWPAIEKLIIEFKDRSKSLLDYEKTEA